MRKVVWGSRAEVQKKSLALVRKRFAPIIRKKLKIGIGIGKSPAVNSQELHIGQFLTGQGRREDKGEGGGMVSLPVTK